jgi:hypothetical protein
MTRKLSTWKKSGTEPRILLRQDGEAGVGAFIGIAGRLVFLDDGDQLRRASDRPWHDDAAALQRVDEIGLAALVRHHDLAQVADTFRRHMLIGARVLGSAEAWMPALVAKAEAPT